MNGIYGAGLLAFEQCGDLAWSFVGAIVVLFGWFLVAPMFGRRANRAAIRMGLRLDGVTGKQADDIVEWHERHR